MSKLEEIKERYSIGLQSEFKIELLQDIEFLIERVEKLEAELKVTDHILEGRNTVLDALECPVHGQCVPGALEKIKKFEEVSQIADEFANAVNTRPELFLQMGEYFKVFAKLVGAIDRAKEKR